MRLRECSVRNPCRRSVMKSPWRPLCSSACTALHHERVHSAQFALVLGIFHALVAMMGRHRCKALLRGTRRCHAPCTKLICGIGWTKDCGSAIARCFTRIGPKLARQIELHVDFQRLGNVDASIAALGRVVQLAIRRMAGARVVPGVGALPAPRRQAFRTSRC